MIQEIRIDKAKQVKIPGCSQNLFLLKIDPSYNDKDFDKTKYPDYETDEGGHLVSSDYFYKRKINDDCMFRNGVTTVDFSEFDFIDLSLTGELEQYIVHKSVFLNNIVDDSKSNLLEIRYDRYKDYKECTATRRELNLFQISTAFDAIQKFLTAIKPKAVNSPRKEKGKLVIKVRDYQRPISDNEQKLIDFGVLSKKEVVIENDGITFQEVKDLMINLHENYPEEARREFWHKVDFQII